jgi:hypothetical protein
MYDSTEETLTHISQVQNYINTVIEELKERAENHDKTKLGPFEKPIFDKFTPMLKNTTYGSEEYKDHLSNMQVALKHHYSHNSHHPEHSEKGISGMTLIDLVEMICDWQAATKRHADGDIMKSIELNQKRFGYSDEMKSILENTVNFLVKGAE